MILLRLKLKYLFINLLLLIPLSLFASSFIHHLKGKFVNPTAQSEQMILVLAEDWTSTTGILQRFERKTAKDPWHKVGKTINVSLGKNGLGWGVGLHGKTLTKGPEVVEGAVRSPVGVFELDLAFGQDDQEKFGIKLPYQPITNTVFCPDDPKSKFYNSLVDTKKVSKDWDSAEDMYRYMQEGVYRHGIVINHNYKKPIPGRGSCFFIHVHRGPGVPTGGCTAFSHDLVKKVIVWLNPDKHPILVQLPEKVFAKFEKSWHLPKADHLSPKDFVYLRQIDPTILQDIRYATDHNFIGRPVKGYQAAECILTRRAATKLQQVQKELKQSSYSLKVYDCYRPTRAVNDFVSWGKQKNQQQMKAEFYPQTNKENLFKFGFIDTPSSHSRGSTVDLTIVPLPTPKQALYHKSQRLISCIAPYNKRFHDGSIDMGTGFDCMDMLSHGNNKEINSTAYQNRQFLKNIMKKYGFNSIPKEWWHFTLENEPYPDQYFNFPIMNNNRLN